MLSLSASPGDICTRLDFTPRKSFILYGDPGILDSWIYLEPPETGVESVNGQTGITFITPEDIGASPVDHVHEPPVIIKEVNGNHVKFRFEEASGDFSLYVNNALVAALQFGTIQTLAGEFCKIVREGNLLYWVNPETNEKLPFA